MKTKVYNGTTWSESYSGIKVRKSGAWQGINYTTKVWDGGAWVPLNGSVRPIIPIVGTMASDFSITLGELPAGTYTLAYIDEQGDGIGYDDIGEVTV